MNGCVSQLKALTDPGQREARLVESDHLGELLFAHGLASSSDTVALEQAADRGAMTGVLGSKLMHGHTRLVAGDDGVDLVVRDPALRRSLFASLALNGGRGVCGCLEQERMQVSQRVRMAGCKAHLIVSR